MRLSLLLLILLQPPAPAANPNADAVNQQIQTFAQRMHDKQEDAILASYTRDAVFIDPTGHRFGTPAELRKLYDQVFATYDSDLHMNAPTLRVNGSAFHATGTWTETLRERKSGKEQHVHGTYNFTLRTYYDGHWSFSRMQWTAQQ